MYSLPAHWDWCDYFKHKNILYLGPCSSVVLVVALIVDMVSIQFASSSIPCQRLKFSSWSVMVLVTIFCNHIAGVFPSCPYTKWLDSLLTNILLHSNDSNPHSIIYYQNSHDSVFCYNFSDSNDEIWHIYGRGSSNPAWRARYVSKPFLSVWRVLLISPRRVL